MKIKRYVSTTGRSALAQAKQELGPDAVILSNRNVDGHVELVAAVDLDEQSLQQSAAASTEVSGAQQDPALGELQQELERLRGVLEGELLHINGNQQSPRASTSPRQHLIKRLTKLGLSPRTSSVIANQTRAGELSAQWREAQQLLADRIAVLDGTLEQNSKVVALVGSTGVGKTTTVAKLAARSVLRHGPRQVALITTDCYRIGGQEQLETFARYLGIPVLVATEGPQLEEALKEVANRKLVLIDTAGMSQRDMRLYEQFATLKSVGQQIDCHVVLSATALPGSLNEVVQVFGKDALAGAIVTKLDEASTLGGVIDVLIRNNLPISWLSAGQNVPEDLQQARADDLVSQAVALASSEQRYQRRAQTSIAV